MSTTTDRKTNKRGGIEAVTVKDTMATGSAYTPSKLKLNN